MFRHKNLRSAESGLGGEPDSMGEPQNKPNSSCNDEWFVFCHGYNVNGDSARGWASEFFKRLHVSGSNARFLAVSWHGDEGQKNLPVVGRITPDYQANVNNAFGTADELAALLSNLNGDVTIAAHSLGNMVVSSAIHDWGARPKNYFMIDAAVAKEAYDAAETQDTTLYNGVTQDTRMMSIYWASTPNILRASEWHTLFEAGTDKRKRLTWRDRLSDVLTSGVNVYNFHSTGEEVLRNPDQQDPVVAGVPTDPLPWLTANKTWAVQEKRKGWALTGHVHSSNYGGWMFNFDAQDNGQYVYWSNGAWSGNALAVNVNAAFKQRLKRLPYFDDSTHTALFTETEGDGTSASNYAQTHRNTLLCQMIPATTLATGANELHALKLPGGDHNFDMNTLFMTDSSEWPHRNSATNIVEWRHSDIREIAYTHLYAVFQKIIDEANLDNSTGN